jgi:hypothetical protein
MRAGVSRFVLICILVLVVGLVSSAAVPPSVVLADLTTEGMFTGASGIAAPSAVALAWLDNCNDLSCG